MVDYQILIVFKWVDMQKSLKVMRTLDRLNAFMEKCGLFIITTKTTPIL